MKIYYFNDTANNQYVWINDLIGNPHKFLPSGTGDYFEIELKENQCPFIKVWESDHVLISFITNSQSK